MLRARATHPCRLGSRWLPALAMLLTAAGPAVAEHRRSSPWNNGYDVYDAEGNKIQSVRPAPPPAEPKTQAQINHEIAIDEVQRIDQDRRNAARFQAIAEGRRADVAKMELHFATFPIPARIDWSKVPAIHHRPAAMLPEALATLREAGAEVSRAETAAMHRAIAADSAFRLAMAEKIALTNRLRAARLAQIAAQQDAAAISVSSPDAIPTAEYTAVTMKVSALQRRFLDADPAVLAARLRLARAKADLALLKSHFTDSQAIKMLQGRGYW